MKGFHPFHIVDPSPWPVFGSLSLLSSVIMSFLYFYGYGESSGYFFMWILSLVSIVLTCFQWWRDVSREGTFQGHHTFKVVNGLKLGMVMFILSEVMFFFSFFFGFFFVSLNPDVEIGMKWPPSGVESLSFLSVPLLNTVILLSSGVSITWAHHGILESNFKTTVYGMIWTILLGGVFSFFQFLEYFESNFTISDCVFGSVFFIATGFHGIHVLIGSLFILVSLIRICLNFMTKKNHLGFEMAAWYWHFVDVVWLFLYISIYWWGS
uniref:Cytochrome c oxidase subunit 3 n=1 Tax=Columbicola passerinae TaxID=128994 RepID=A0A6G8QSP0_9NEOP|nr:cytochrome oxidase subunit 3 [Columbicola passerinae]